MAITKRAGVYFTEAQGTVASEYDGNFVPLFIVETATAVATIDNQITAYDSIAAFATVVRNKGLTNTVNFIEQALGEAGIGRFYVYSIKRSGNVTLTSVIEDCASRTEIRDIVYIEEEKSIAPTIAQKVSEISTALDDNFENGTLRNGLVVPYGTIEYLATQSGDGTTEDKVVAGMATCIGTNDSGRVTSVVPDVKCAGADIGKFIGREYNDEIGANRINTSIDALTYNFNDTQILALVNDGCLVTTSKYVRGDIEYRVEVGVTHAINQDKSDQLLISRSIADQVLRDVKEECDQYIRTKMTANTVKLLQGDVDSIISEYVASEDVIQAGTKLTVSQSNVPYTLNINGTVQVAGSLLIINVDTTLTV